MIDLSVVLATDEAATAGRTLDALWAQTARDRLELVLVSLSGRPLETLDETWTSVVSGLGNANVEGAISWANLITDYGPWLAAVPAGEIAATPPHNAAFERSFAVRAVDTSEIAFSGGWSRTRRAAYALGAPLIPLVLAARLAGPFTHARRAWDLPWTTSPAILLGLAASACGELAAFVTGERDEVTRRTDEFQLHKVRYTGLGR
jgi:hypothetical protein